MRNLRRRWPALVIPTLSIAALALVAGCGNDVTAPEGRVPVKGHIVVMDDAGAGSEDARGSVVVIAKQNSSALWAASTSRGVPSPGELRYVQARFDPKVLTGLAEVVAPLRDGQFSLSLSVGDYLLCLGDGSPPQRVHGCTEVVAAGNPVDLDLTTGEGGLRPTL